MRERGLIREKRDVVGSTVNPAENGKHEFCGEFFDSSQQKTGNWIVSVVLGGSCYQLPCYHSRI